MAAVTALSREALDRFLRDREHATRSPLVQAVYAGLRDRIRQGQFDEEAEQ